MMLHKSFNVSSIVVRYCTGLRQIDDRDIENGAERRRLANDEVKRSQDALNRTYLECPRLGGSTSEHTQDASTAIGCTLRSYASMLFTGANNNESILELESTQLQDETRRSNGNSDEILDRWLQAVIQRQKDAKRARSGLAAVSEEPRPPNTFVAVLLGQCDVDSRLTGDAVHEIGHTKVVPHSCSPSWHYKMDPIPLGKKIRCCTLDDDEEQANRLIFQIWHDDGEQIDNVPAVESHDNRDAGWYRANPRKCALLAYACWHFEDMLCDVGLSTLCKDLQLFNARTGRKMKDKFLTISAELDVDFRPTPTSMGSRICTFLQNCKSSMRVRRRT